ncbi:MAG: amidoligase family protein [Ruminococcus sp.]|nr:amidoligase family protein [Ruminococcus sp.]
MKNQNFGVEIELTGITRETAAKVIANFFGTSHRHECSSYDTYTAKDNKGRIWKVMRDSSINTEGRNSAYSSEVVTPILKYEDIEDLQEILRRLRKAGAKANSSCGIHIHVGAEKHTPKTLRNLVNIMASKQDMIFKALEINPNRAQTYCKKLESELVNRINEKKPKTKDEMADEWYRNYHGARQAHYNPSRYHGLNLHAVFTKGTVEFRLFNSTTHAGKLKAYIQFCLAVNNQALTQKYASPRVTVSDNECFTFRTWLLRMGLIGNEFKTARHHLLANLEGNIAWRYSA